MKIHAVRTGWFRCKAAQRVRRPGGLLRVLTDDEWTGWLPILSWVIEHPEGVIVVDTGETAEVSEPSYFPRWHPYYRGSVRFDVKPEEEIGPQLRGLGIRPGDVRTLVLTHLHTDHVGGLRHFPGVRVLAPEGDLRLARSLTGRLLGYLPNRWPKWFHPAAITFEQDGPGPFERAHAATRAGDVLVVPTPGHTPGHLSVVVKDEDAAYFLAGDASYSQRLLIDGTPDGVSSAPSAAIVTRERILALADSGPVVYLPSHDPESVGRLRAVRTLG